MTAARMRLVARVGGSRSALPPFVVLSVALHAGFLAAMLLMPSLRSAKSFPLEPAIQAVLLPAPAPRQPAPTTPAAPAVEPDPEEQPSRELTAVEDDPPETVPDPDPPPKPKPRRVDKPKPKAPQPKPAAPSRKAGAPSSSQAGPVGNPEGVDALAGMGSEFNWYRDAVARALYSSWRQPVLNTAEPIEVAVAFEITRNGAVRGVRLERESGVSAVDRSVLRAVHEAALPPLPRNYRRSVQPAVFVFRLYPE